MHIGKQIVSMGTCKQEREVLGPEFSEFLGKQNADAALKRRLFVGPPTWVERPAIMLLGDGASENFRERLGDNPQDIRDRNRPPQLLRNRGHRDILDTTGNDGLEKGKIV